jgi:hypothetical protein
VGLRFTLELEFSAANLDGYVDAGTDEFPEPFKVCDHLLQFGSFLLSSACHESCLKVARKQLSALFQLPEVLGQKLWAVLCPQLDGVNPSEVRLRKKDPRIQL